MGSYVIHYHSGVLSLCVFQSCASLKDLIVQNRKFIMRLQTRLNSIKKTTTTEEAAKIIGRVEYTKR